MVVPSAVNNGGDAGDGLLEVGRAAGSEEHISVCAVLDSVSDDEDGMVVEVSAVKVVDYLHDVCRLLNLSLDNGDKNRT